MTKRQGCSAKDGAATFLSLSLLKGFLVFLAWLYFLSLYSRSLPRFGVTGVSPECLPVVFFDFPGASLL